MILSGGTVYTLDPALPRIAALAITRDGRVARGVEAWEGDTSQVSGERIDLDGRVVLPGFADAHVHFLSWALDQRLLDLSTAAAPAACAELVARRGVDDQGWIIGSGLREEWIGDELDRASQGTRVALWSYDRHTLWLSAAAMEAVGSSKALLRETEADVPLPGPSDAEALAAVAAAQRAAQAVASGSGRSYRPTAG
jgi:predicted amidohydrolase YtcJ